MSTAFQTLISGQLPEWAVEVADARDLNTIKDEQHGPTLAFTQLELPSSARAYLSHLSYAADYGPRSPFAIERNIADSVKKYRRASHKFNIHGWCNNPEHSKHARRQFIHKASAFFPDRSGREELLESLSHHYALLASDMNRSVLSFLFRALPAGSGDSDLHLDPDSEYVSIAYLRGITTPHANPASYSADELYRKTYENGERLERLPITPAIQAGLAAPPAESAAIWRGTTLQRASAHMEPENPDQLRILCLTDFVHSASQPAHNQIPGTWQKLQNIWKNHLSAY